MFTVKDKIGMTADGHRVSYGKPSSKVEKKRLRMLSSLRTTKETICSNISKPKKVVQTKRFRTCLSNYKRYFHVKSWSYHHKLMKMESYALSQAGKVRPCLITPALREDEVPCHAEILNFCELKMTIKFKYKDQADST